VGSKITVQVGTVISGVTKDEFILLIPQFEKDMAIYYEVPEDNVLVVGVEEVAAAAGVERRRAQDAGLDVDYVVISEDRESADAIVAKTEDEDAAVEAVKQSVEVAAVMILQKEVVVDVVVEEVVKERLSVSELEEQQEASEQVVFVPVAGGGEEGGGGSEIIMAIVIIGLAIGAVYNEVRKRDKMKKAAELKLQEEKLRAEEEKFRKEEEEKLAKLEEERMEKLKKVREEELLLETKKLEKYEQERKDKEEAYRRKLEEEKERLEKERLEEERMKELAQQAAEKKREKLEATAKEEDMVVHFRGPPLITNVKSPASKNIKMVNKAGSARKGLGNRELFGDSVGRSGRKASVHRELGEITPDKGKGEDLLKWLKEKDVGVGDDEDDNELLAITQMKI